VIHSDKTDVDHRRSTSNEIGPQTKQALFNRQISPLLEPQNSQDTPPTIGGSRRAKSPKITLTNVNDWLLSLY